MYTPVQKYWLSFQVYNFLNSDFLKFLEHFGVPDKSVGKHLFEILLKSTLALSTQ